MVRRERLPPPRVEAEALARDDSPRDGRVLRPRDSALRLPLFDLLLEARDERLLEPARELCDLPLVRFRAEDEERVLRDLEDEEREEPVRVLL